MSYPPGPPHEGPQDEGPDPRPDAGYQPPAYGAPGRGAPGHGAPGYAAPTPPTNGKALAALITGISTLVLAFCTCGFGGLPGGVAIFLGVRARREIRDGGGRQGGDGLAIGGIITGAIATVIGILLIALLVLWIATGPDLTRNFGSDRYNF